MWYWHQQLEQSVSGGKSFPKRVPKVVRTCRFVTEILRPSLQKKEGIYLWKPHVNRMDLWVRPSQQNTLLSQKQLLTEIWYPYQQNCLKYGWSCNEGVSENRLPVTWITEWTSVQNTSQVTFKPLVEVWLYYRLSWRAMWCHTTYNDLLPVLLSVKALKRDKWQSDVFEIQHSSYFTFSWSTWLTIEQKNIIRPAFSQV